MAIIRLEISATPAHVRTARLVATALARRSGVSDGVLDEIRLAVGEACSRAVNLHRAHVPDQAVQITLDDGGPFAVVVTDMAPAGADVGDVGALDLGDGADMSHLGTLELLPPGFGLAVIGGLVEDVVVTPRPDGVGTRVQMRWPMNGADSRR